MSMSLDPEHKRRLWSRGWLVITELHCIHEH